MLQVDPTVKVLVWAPFAKDEAVIVGALREHGHAAIVPATAEDLSQQLEYHRDVLICTQEGFTHAVRDSLHRVLADQPAWSRLPLLIMVDLHHESEHLNEELRELMTQGLVTILHRPMRPLEFTTAIHNAVTVRQKQLEIRDHIAYQVELQRELNHRVKNMMSTFMAIHRMSLRQSHDLETFAEKFNRRIGALSVVHDLLHQTRDGRRSMEEIARKVLAPYDSEEGRRIVVEGPPLELSQDSAMSVGLILNELATNAVKYGALSQDGSVAVLWSADRARDVLRMEWTERDGPKVRPPQNNGYGTRFLKASAASLGGSFELDFRPSGLRAVLTAPLGRIETKYPA